MPDEGFARDFKKSLGTEDEVLAKKVDLKPEAISLLFNTTRQNIIRFLCERPCNNLTNIANKIHVTLPTAKFHLSKLESGGIVVSRKKGKKQVFCLIDMVDDDMFDILSVLNEDMVNSIYKKINDMPGITQSALCEQFQISHQGLFRYLKKMVGIGLIKQFKTGRFTRYFPTELLEQMDKVKKKRLRGFKKMILQVLKKEGLKPELIRSTESELVVTIRLGGEVSTLRLFTRPFSSVLKD